MMTERLKAFVDGASQLPPEAQDKLVAQIESALDNARWDAQMRSEHDLVVLRALADEARREPKLPFPTLEEMERADQAERTFSHE